jgi:hypothetical protein
MHRPPPRCAGVTIRKTVEIVQRHSRIGPYLLQAAAEHAPLVIEIFQQMPRPGEDRTRSGVEIFVGDT